MFYLLFSSLTTICHLLLKRQPHSPDVVHCFINFSYKGLQKGWVPKPDWNPNEILNRNLSIQLQHKNPLSYSPQVLINFLLAIGIFQEKKSKLGGYSIQNADTPLESTQNCATAIAISKARNQDNWKLHMTFFLFILGNFTSFFIDPWNVHILFFQYTWKFYVLNPCLDLFCNSPLFMLCLRNFVLRRNFMHFHSSFAKNGSSKIYFWDNHLIL